jgi:hypothetical protein
MCDNTILNIDDNSNKVLNDNIKLSDDDDIFIKSASVENNNFKRVIRKIFSITYILIVSILLFVLIICHFILGWYVKNICILINSEKYIGLLLLTGCMIQNLLIIDVMTFGRYFVNCFFLLFCQYFVSCVFILLCLLSLCVVIFVAGLIILTITGIIFNIHYRMMQYLDRF